MYIYARPKHYMPPASSMGMGGGGHKNQDLIQSDIKPCHQPCQHQKGKKGYTYEIK